MCVRAGCQHQQLDGEHDLPGTGPTVTARQRNQCGGTWQPLRARQEGAPSASLAPRVLSGSAGRLSPTSSLQRIDVPFFQQPFRSHDIEAVVDAEHDDRLAQDLISVSPPAQATRRANCGQVSGILRSRDGISASAALPCGSAVHLGWNSSPPGNREATTAMSAAKTTSRWRRLLPPTCLHVLLLLCRSLCAAALLVAACGLAAGIALL